MDAKILTIPEYLENLFNSVQKAIKDSDYNINSLPKGFPISRATFYNWKKGDKGVRTCTIIKVCKYFKWPEPKVFI